MQLQLRQEVSQAGGDLQDAALMATAVSCPYSSSRAGAPALLLVALLLAAASWTTTAAAKNDTQRFRPGDELRRYRRVQALLKRLNKPALRSIQARACSAALFSSVSVLCGARICDDTDSDAASLVAYWSGSGCRSPCACVRASACRAPTATSSTACRRTCSRRSSTPS